MGLIMTFLILLLISSFTLSFPYRQIPLIYHKPCFENSFALSFYNFSAQVPGRTKVLKPNFLQKIFNEILKPLYKNLTKYLLLFIFVGSMSEIKSKRKAHFGLSCLYLLIFFL